MRLVLALALLAAAPVQADEVLKAFQDWKLAVMPNPVTNVASYFIGTLTSDGDSAFGLQCSPALHSYAFFVEDPIFKVVKPAQKLTLDFRLVNEKPGKLLAVSLGTGRVVVEERHQHPSFNSLLMSVYGAETGVGFSSGSRALLFSLKGFSEAAEELGKKCGFTPNDETQQR
ncbi:hypothetical protein [Bradyrhizobium sp. Tv2a-2]|uniref:hypothetical protein n=1 Tax=Bradyrhizobium sp. Tv2a-2 TaxID=113395 RepID=UPI000463948B|nr:hypothetical protein [Bradyrhizobium sp. Tv2a-2]